MSARAPAKKTAPDRKTAPADQGANTIVRLYIAGATPNSRRAQANLQAIMTEFSVSSPFRIEIVDVFVEPHRAVADSVIVTPTLIAFGPKSRGVIIGDLSETEKVRSLLKAAFEIG